MPPLFGQQELEFRARGVLERRVQRPVAQKQRRRSGAERVRRQDQARSDNSVSQRAGNWSTQVRPHKSSPMMVRASADQSLGQYSPVGAQGRVQYSFS